MIGLNKSSLINGENLKRQPSASKATPVQLQRLSEKTPKGDATVCSHANRKHEREIRRGFSATDKVVVTNKKQKAGTIYPQGMQL